ARLRRGLDLREPGWTDDRALVPRLRLSTLADRAPRHEPRRRARGPVRCRGSTLGMLADMANLADRTLELQPGARARFGAGAIESLPELVRMLDGRRAFVVSDPGALRSGV